VPNAHSVDVVYTAVNKPTQITDTLARNTNFAYDGQNDVLQMTRCRGAGGDLHVSE
jgi:YD repeat-containing protein